MNRSRLRFITESLARIVVLVLASTPELHAGTIAGKVKFISAVPETQPLQVSHNHDYCGTVALPEAGEIRVNVEAGRWQ